MSSPYVLPVATSQDPSNPQSPNPYAIYGYPGYGGFSPYTSYGAENASQNWGTAIGQAGQFVNPNASMEDIFSANRNQISATGNIIGQEASNQLNYYSPWQQQYQQASNAALNQLAQTPGYTPQEAGQINVDYGQYQTSPDQWNQINQNLQTGIGNEGTMLNQYQSGLGGSLSDYGTNLSAQTGAYQSGIGGATSAYGQGVGGAMSAYGTGVGSALDQGRTGLTGAVGQLGSGLDAAQGKFAGLNSAVYDPSLGFDPNRTEKQMTDQDVSDLVTAAGTTVGNQFGAQREDLLRRAAAQGNTSPEALAAIERDLTTQQASAAGDAMTNARIQALQAQYGRAAGIEQQRLGASQTQQGLRATASTTEETAAQAAAGQAGLAGIGAQQYLTGAGLQGAEAVGQAGMQGSEAIGQAGMTGAQLAGQAGINAANTMGQQNLNALYSYYPTAVNQMNTMTGQQYQAGVNQANTQYAQGTGTAQMTAGGAANVGQARQAGQAAYRSGVAGQQGMAQQGGQAAMQAQLGAYGTQTGGITQNAAAQGSFEVGKPSLGDTAGKAAMAGLFSAGGRAEGDIVTEPTISKLAENGPELVVPLSTYKSKRRRDGDNDWDMEGVA